MEAAQFIDSEDTHEIMEKIEINPFNLPRVAHASPGPADDEDFRGKVRVKVVVLTEDAVLPRSFGKDHVNMTLSVREAEITPDLALCIDRNPVYAHIKREPTLVWLLVSSTGDDEWQPDVVSVRFKTLEDLGQETKSGIILKELSQQVNSGYEALAIVLTYRDVSNFCLQPAERAFRDESFMKEYDNVLRVLRNLSVPASRQQNDAVAVTFLSAPSNKQEADNLNHFKSRFDATSGASLVKHANISKYMVELPDILEDIRAARTQYPSSSDDDEDVQGDAIDEGEQLGPASEA